MSPRPLWSRACGVLALTALVAACGASEAAAPDTIPPAGPPSTLGGVGTLPPTVPTDPVEVDVDVETSVSSPASDPTTTTDAAAEEEPLVGELVEGNRVIAIGDSVLASTSRRYGRRMCDGLNPLGWTVEVDAEPGRFVDFGSRVLRRRLDPANGLDWDVAVILLGTNYRSDRERYEEQLDEMLDELEPRPTLLLTVTEYRPNWSEVNDVIRSEGERRDNVTVLDWSTLAEEEHLLGGDGLHPTETGVEALVDLIASSLGQAPPADEAECLSDQFVDDSAIGRSPTGTGTLPGSGNWSGSSGGSSGSSGGSTGSGGSSGGSAGGGTSTGTTSPPVETEPPPSVDTQPPPPVDTTQTSPPPSPDPTTPSAPPPPGIGPDVTLPSDGTDGTL